MKKIIILLIMLLIILPSLCLAESDVELIWQYSDPNIDGYKVYRREGNNNYDFNNPVSTILDPNIKTITHYKIPDGIYFWVVSAFENHIASPNCPNIYLESPVSNEVKANLKTLLSDTPITRIKKILKIEIVEP